MEDKIESKPKRHLPWTGIGVLFSTLASIALISVFCFAGYKISFLGKQLQSTVLTMQQHVSTLQADTESIKQDTRQSLDTMNQAITELHKTISSDKDTWRIMEAQYYVKLADTKLQFEGNISAAIQLLQAADTQIHNVNDPRLDAARKVLAQDIVSLQSVPHVDYTGLYMRLYALDQEINKLPLLVKPASGNVIPTEVKNNEPWWKRGLQQTGQALQKIVIIRYHASGTPPFMTPDQQDFLLQNVHAMFEKAMWALLNKQPEIYQASLQQTTHWISQYFVVDAPATQNMLKSLTELQQMDIRPTLPRVSASLQAFNDYLANMKNTP